MNYDSPHNISMAKYESDLAKAKVTEGSSVFNEVVETLAKDGEQAISDYAIETERLWKEASPWEKIGLGRRYDVLKKARERLKEK